MQASVKFLRNNEQVVLFLEGDKVIETHRFVQFPKNPSLVSAELYYKVRKLAIVKKGFLQVQEFGENKNNTGKNRNNTGKNRNNGR